MQKSVKENKQILFTGHSSGGSIANLATIWFLEKYLKPEYNYKISPSSPLCVTFGCPLTGNHIFSHSLRHENWAHYFIHFVMRYDIVPRIMLAPISSIKLEFQKVLQFLNAKSVNLARASIDTFDASNFYMKVMKNASSVVSHAACNLMGNTNLLLEIVSNFIPLSPYKPFGTYVFCTGNGKLVILRNPYAVLQPLFYSSQLCHEEECTNIAQISLQQHFGYENELQESFQMLNEIYLEPLEQLPLSSDSTSSDIATINSALNDLGLVSSISFACFNKFENLEFNLFLKNNCFLNMTCNRLYKENKKSISMQENVLNLEHCSPKNFLSYIFVLISYVMGSRAQELDSLHKNKSIISGVNTTKLV